MKKLLKVVFLYIILSMSFVFAAGQSAPTLNCGVGLPWCVDDSLSSPTAPNLSNNKWKKFIVKIIDEFIQIVAVFAVFALIASWIYYLISAWNDEKVAKAKKWLIWSLVWVFLSVTSWWIVSWLNGLNILN